MVLMIGRSVRGRRGNVMARVRIGLGRRDGGSDDRNAGEEQERRGHRIIIQIAMPSMNRFSVSDTKPSGTLPDPPTHAHLRVRRSI